MTRAPRRLDAAIRVRQDLLELPHISTMQIDLGASA
jgi:hypothetical protein